MTFPIILLPVLPTFTIVPSPLDEEDTFLQYMMRQYEDIAFAVNARDFNYFTIPISDVAANIPNLPNFGSFMILVSGIASTQPTGIWVACKSTSTVAGTLGATNPLVSQVGSGTWAGINLTITAGANNFQIAHNLANTTADFSIRIVGTQG